MSYWDLPWEIEAHGREVGLFIRYCEENKLAPNTNGQKYNICPRIMKVGQSRCSRQKFT